MKLVGLFLVITITLQAQVPIRRPGNGGEPGPSVVNLGTQPGVDCTGATDSSSGINTVFASLTGKKLIVPNNCMLRVTRQLRIVGQTDFAIEGQGLTPNQSNATPYIFGCSGAAGPVLYINRSSYWAIGNFGVYAKGSSCSSSFTGSIVWSNLGSGGFTSTFARVEGMSLETNPNGSQISGYFAFGVGMNSSGVATGASNPNEEQLTFRDNFVHCQNSSRSYGIWMVAANADNGSAVNNRIDACFQGIRIDGGDMKLIEKNHFDGNGAYSVFGAGGSAIYLAGCASGVMSIAYNETGDGGPFINTKSSGVGCSINITGNWLGISDLAPTAFPIYLSTPTNFPITLIGNNFFMTAGTRQTAIGADNQSSCAFGPLGMLVDIANTINDITKVGGWSGCVGKSGVIPFQNGEYHQFSPLGNKALVIEQSGLNADLRNAAQVYAYPDVTSSTVTCDKIGHVWFDTTTTTTALKVCLNVSGTLRWVVK